MKRIIFGIILTILGVYIVALPEDVMAIFDLKYTTITYFGAVIASQGFNPGIMRGIGAGVAISGIVLLIFGILSESAKQPSSIQSSNLNPPQYQVEQEVNNKTNYCNRCGQKIEGAAKFCSNCGDKLSMYCARCGTQSSEGDVFCRKCGFPINQMTAPGAPMKTPQANSNAQGTPRIKRKSGFATASLVLALVGIIIGPSLVFAIIFGAIALNKMEHNSNLEGRGQAIAGLLIGIIGLVISIVLAVGLLHYTSNKPV